VIALTWLEYARLRASRAFSQAGNASATGAT